MKKYLIIPGILLVWCTLLTAQETESRIVTPFDEGWKFALGDKKGAGKKGYNDSQWRTLNLPHDWSIEGENLENAPGGGNVGYFPMGIGWYRKTFDLPAGAEGKLTAVEFDGIYENSEVWINGQLLGKHPYGYTSFGYDLTPWLKKKGNVLAVRVDNSHQPNSRWYTGSGIYRHVRLVCTDPVHVEKWGVFVYTKSIDGEKAVIQINTSVVNAAKEAKNAVSVKHTLLDADGREVASVQSSVSLDAGGKKEVAQQMEVKQPKLWSVETPYLYTLTTQLVADGKVIDSEKTSTGIRTIKYTADKGFLLNGQQVKMKGVNLHHDAGAMGAAVPERVWERRIEILKSGGCNAIRTAHNPPAPEFLDLCDKHGMLVMDEAFDEWLAGKRDYTYKLYFAEWHDADLRSMVLRDRNHPSVVMWSIGNEIPDQSTAEGPALAREMIATCHELDPTRLVTTGNDNIAADQNAATEEFLDAFANDITGYNYPDRYRERRELLYAIDKARHPERIVVGTETGAISGSRAQMRRTADAPQMPSFFRRMMGGTARLIDVEQRWKFTILNDYVTGDFMWTGIDYYGETFWPQRGSGSGYLDNCGFKKDGYWFYKSIWTTEPVVHLTGDWNKEGEEGKIQQVVCFTNCNEVELFLNGKSYGVKTFEFPRTGNQGDWMSYAPGKVFTSTADLHLAWDVPYEPGELKAVAKKGDKEYTFSLVTTGEPASLRLTVDRDRIKACPSDVVHATVEVLDSKGNLVPYADNLITFKVEGARVIGIESGNMGDLSSTKANQRKAYGGLCLAIIQADKAGKLLITASAPGMEAVRQEVTAE